MGIRTKFGLAWLLATIIMNLAAQIVTVHAQDYYLLSRSDKQQIVDYHNRLRVRYGVAKPITWDSTLEQMTKTLSLASLNLDSGSCDMGRVGHSHLAPGFGECLAATMGSPLDFDTLLSGIRSWADEISSISPQILRVISQNPTPQIGHATQMVSARSSKLGCSMVRRSGCDLQVLVCSYFPPGNMVGSSYDVNDAMSEIVSMPLPNFMRNNRPISTDPSMTRKALPAVRVPSNQVLTEIPVPTLTAVPQQSQPPPIPTLASAADREKAKNLLVRRLKSKLQLILIERMTRIKQLSVDTPKSVLPPNNTNTITAPPKTPSAVLPAYSMLPNFNSVKGVMFGDPRTNDGVRPPELNKSIYAQLGVVKPVLVSSAVFVNSEAAWRVILLMLVVLGLL